jgi:iron complex transport system substrate-binding protein
MRAFALASAASLALAACAAPPPPLVESEVGAAPQRVVSLNLCTDELLLLLADPRQIASVTHLSARAEETPLWQQARGYPANDGTMASAATAHPDLILTMGGGGDRLRIAERLGARTIDLPFPTSLEDVVQAIRRIAAALGRHAQGEALVARIAQLRATAPGDAVDTLWIGGGGRTVAADGLEAEWMVLAGYTQRAVTGDQLQLETLLVAPPQVLLRSDYRQDQYSRGQAWLAHPLAHARGTSRTIVTDGRRWTCMGPLLIEEIERLRREREQL